MLMTEKDAAEKWCPAARVFAVKKGPFWDNRGENEDHPTWTKCLGSGCMAWRWDRRVDPPTCHWHSVNLPLGSPEPERPANVPASWVWENDSDEREFCRWVEPVKDADTRRRGYCGLGGNP